MRGDSMPRALLAFVLFCGVTHALGSAMRIPLRHREAPLRRRTQAQEQESSSSPLFQGYGTHFAYIWVGSPPQRVSVIVDTGSGITAFPCEGCRGCGSHTDPYFAPSSSNSSKELVCETKSDCSTNSCVDHKCTMSQSYAEGSRWLAHLVEDQVWIGGETVDEVDASPLSIPFTFGCQTSETGLFITQLADGIMGMMIGDANLASKLQDAGKLSSRSFSLCFVLGGGVMTLGGTDEQLHSSPMKYAKHVRKLGSGWYTVKVVDIYIGGEKVAVSNPDAVYDRGKGMIVDSGTTDTYLPRACATQFKDAWQRETGFSFTNNALQLSRTDMLKLPNIKVHLEGISGTVEVEMSPIDYMELQNDFSYVARIYLDEPQGGVFGANFMRSHDVHFDVDDSSSTGRIGFAPSDCTFSPQNNDCELTEFFNSSCTPNVPCAAEENGKEVDGTMKGVRYIITPPSGKGLACGDLELETDCKHTCGEETNGPAAPTNLTCLVSNSYSSCSKACKKYRFTDAITCAIDQRKCYDGSCAGFRGYAMNFHAIFWGLPSQWDQPSQENTQTIIEFQNLLAKGVAGKLEDDDIDLSVTNFFILDNCVKGLSASFEFEAFIGTFAANLGKTQSSSEIQQQNDADQNKYDHLLRALTETLMVPTFKDEMLSMAKDALNSIYPSSHLAQDNDTEPVAADQKYGLWQISLNFEEIVAKGPAEIPEDRPHSSDSGGDKGFLVLITVISVLVAIATTIVAVLNHRKLRIQMEAKGRNLMARLNPSHSKYYKYSKVSTAEEGAAAKDDAGSNGLDEDIGVVLPDTWAREDPSDGHRDA